MSSNRRSVTWSHKRLTEAAASEEVRDDDLGGAYIWNNVINIVPTALKRCTENQRRARCVGMMT